MERQLVTAEDGRRKTRIDLSMLDVDRITFPPAVKNTGRPTVKPRHQLSSPPMRLPFEYQYKDIQLTSPWKRYKQICDVRLGVDFRITIAQKTSSPLDFFAIRCISNYDPELQVQDIIQTPELQMLDKIRHDSFVAVEEVFCDKGEMYAVFEYMPVSLDEMQRSRKCIASDHLSAILGPIIEGVAFLSGKGLQHHRLTSSNVLVSEDGAVKIAESDRCRPLASATARSPDLDAVRDITAGLMGAHVKEEGTVNLEDPDQWTPLSRDFLATTTSATSAQELLKVGVDCWQVMTTTNAGQHPLLQRPRKVGELKQNVLIARMSAHCRIEEVYSGEET